MLVWLPDYAAQQAGAGYAVWQRDIQHMEKAFVFGSMGARNGVTAALLMQAGFTGVSDVFSGRDNFFSAYAPKADPRGLVDGLGVRFEISDTIIKKWSTGGPVQSPIDALVDLRQQHPFDASDVQQVVVAITLPMSLLFITQVSGIGRVNVAKVAAGGDRSDLGPPHQGRDHARQHHDAARRD